MRVLDALFEFVHYNCYEYKHHIPLLYLLSMPHQIMNLLQMTVLAGSPGGFLPNMYPGTLAAALAGVICRSSGGSWAGAEAVSSEANGRLTSQVRSYSAIDAEGD